MNYLCTIVYRAYFYDHTEFDSSHNQPIQISLGDISWPEGLWKSILEMRKGEKAKIKIKKKYGFGRKQKLEHLKFPPGFQEEGEKRTRLMTKGIIYEVKLLDWVERHDIQANGVFLKTFITKAPQKSWSTPADLDEYIASYKVYYSPDEILLEKEAQTFSSETRDTAPKAIIEVLQSMKVGEHSTVQVKASFIQEEDKLMVEVLGGKYQPEKDLQIEAQMHKLFKVEEWYKEEGKKSCLKKVIRKGKKEKPNIDSVVKSKHLRK